MGRLAQADSIGRTVGTTLTAVMGPAELALNGRSEVVAQEGLEGLLAMDDDLSSIINVMPAAAGEGLTRSIVAFTSRCVARLLTGLCAEALGFSHKKQAPPAQGWMGRRGNAAAWHMAIAKKQNSEATK